MEMCFPQFELNGGVSKQYGGLELCFVKQQFLLGRKWQGQEYWKYRCANTVTEKKNHLLCYILRHRHGSRIKNEVLQTKRKSGRPCPSWLIARLKSLVTVATRATGFIHCWLSEAHCLWLTWNKSTDTTIVWFIIVIAVFIDVLLENSDCVQKLIDCHYMLI